MCEAMPDDSVSMLMARILTGRPGFVSDPALDTSRNQVVYAHCVGTTRVFGPAGATNDIEFAPCTTAIREVRVPNRCCPRAT